MWNKTTTILITSLLTILSMTILASANEPTEAINDFDEFQDLTFETKKIIESLPSDQKIIIDDKPKDKPDVVLNESLYYDRKYGKYDDLVISADYNAPVTWYPSTGKKAGLKQVTLQVDVENVKTGKVESLKAFVDVPMTYTGHFAYNFTKSGLVTNPVLNVSQWYYSDTWVWVNRTIVEQIDENTTKIIIIPVREFLSYQTIKNSEFEAKKNLIAGTTGLYLDPEIGACGTVSSPGIYKLNTSLTCSGVGISITANDVVIDGNGFYLNETGSTYAVRVNSNVNRTRITNLTLYSGNETLGSTAFRLEGRHTIVEDSRIYGFSRNPVFNVIPSSIAVDNITIRRNVYDGLRLTGTTNGRKFYFQTAGGNITVQDNNLTNMVGLRFNVGNYQNITFENNRVQSFGTDSGSFLFAESGMMNSTIRKNSFNVSGGFSEGGRGFMNNSVFANNSIQKNGTIGFSLYGKNVRFENNTIKGYAGTNPLILFYTSNSFIWGNYFESDNFSTNASTVVNLASTSTMSTVFDSNTCVGFKNLKCVVVEWNNSVVSNNNASLLYSNPSSHAFQFTGIETSSINNTAVQSSLGTGLEHNGARGFNLTNFYAVNTTTFLSDSATATYPPVNFVKYENGYGVVSFTDYEFLNGTQTSGSLSKSDLVIENNSVYISPNNALSVIANKSMNITLHTGGLSGSGLQIYLDGAVCTECYNFTSLSASTVVFNATSTGTYYVSAPVPGSCGSINFPGVYNLTGSVSGSDCYVINANDVLLNGSGYSVVGGGNNIRVVSGKKNVTITGFGEIRGGTVGIKLENNDDVSVFGNVFNRTTVGVQSWNLTNSRVNNNLFNGTIDLGLQLIGTYGTVKSSNVSIVDNTFFDQVQSTNSADILATALTGLEVSRNEFVNSSTGVIFEYVNETVFDSNVLRNGKTSSSYCAKWDSVHWTNITNNNFSDVDTTPTFCLYFASSNGDGSNNRVVNNLFVGINTSSRVISSALSSSLFLNNTVWNTTASIPAYVTVSTGSSFEFANEYGRIVFNKSVFRTYRELHFGDASDDYFIGNRTITFDNAYLNETDDGYGLPMNATLYFNGVSGLSNPQVYKDGVLCGDCNNLTAWSADPLIIDTLVDGVTNYTVVDVLLNSSPVVSLVPHSIINNSVLLVYDAVFVANASITSSALKNVTVMVYNGSGTLIWENTTNTTPALFNRSSGALKENFEKTAVDSCPLGWSCTGEGTVRPYDSSGCSVSPGGTEGVRFLRLGCDEGLGTARSPSFYLPSNVDNLYFLRAGGADAGSGLYVKRVSDGAVLCSAEDGTDTDTFFADSCDGLNAYAGTEVYVWVEDAVSGGWGKVWVDDLYLRDGDNNIIPDGPLLRAGQYYYNVTACSSLDNCGSSETRTFNLSKLSIELAVVNYSNHVITPQNEFFSVVLNVSCSSDLFDCGLVNVSLDPLENCDPESMTCSDSCALAFIPSTSGWSWDGYASCVDSMYSYQVAVDAQCDGYLGAGTGSCATGYDWYTFDFLVCPSFERNGGAVTSANCWCGYGPCSPPAYSSVFDFSSTYFMGSGQRSKGGLINTTIGALPFYTNASSNPLTINLSVGESELVTFWVNATGAANLSINYSFFGYAEPVDWPGRVDSELWNVSIDDPLEVNESSSSCVYSGVGVHYYRCEDNCSIVSPVSHSREQVFINGTGYFRGLQYIRNYSSITITKAGVCSVTTS